ncbi:hypothetical protein J2T56_002397 [Natronobacillus azotifigens]
MKTKTAIKEKEEIQVNDMEINIEQWSSLKNNDP